MMLLLPVIALGGNFMGMCRFSKISLVVAALLSTPVVANAADIARTPLYQAYPVPIVYDWTGLYVGGHVGAGWTGGAGDGGFLGGGQAGFNYQSGQWVLGIEGQMSATTIKDSTSVGFFFAPGLAFGSVTAESRLDWISTLAARAGWAFDRWLVYAKVGGAWTHVSFDVSASVSSIAGSAIAAAWTDRTFSGWMIGLGAEYALWDNWTAKVEYNMMDFGNDFISDNAIHVVKAGLNYRFRL